MYGTTCAAGWKCSRESCLYPSRCKNLRPAGERWFSLLRRAEKIRGVRHLSIGSGIRYDLLQDDVPGLLPELVASYVGGQLKIAPEHTGAVTLRAMRKTPLHDLESFVRTFRSLSAKAGGKYYLLPYLMSAHPGTTQTGMEQMCRRCIPCSDLFPNRCSVLSIAHDSVFGDVLYRG